MSKSFVRLLQTKTFSVSIIQKKTQEFGDRYGEKVKVYTIGEYSKEICGGPHANSTGELKNFKIIKEESSSAGVRRIKAVIDFE